MRLVPLAPRPVSHLTGWMLSGLPLTALQIELLRRNSRIDTLPALLTLAEAIALKLAGGRRSSLGTNATADATHTRFSRKLTSARISSGVALNAPAAVIHWVPPANLVATFCGVTSVLLNNPVKPRPPVFWSPV